MAARETTLAAARVASLKRLWRWSSPTNAARPLAERLAARALVENRTSAGDAMGESRDLARESDPAVRRHRAVRGRRDRALG
ncbi:MAG: hypothetical protein WDM85_05945 [Caulobacteraceae bacterium]